ncbi:MAG: hypothetical protein H7256_05890 [Bdellovibrio sp.]|nr:hypothetical protein [Bdellovibrio sp.]
MVNLRRWLVLSTLILASSFQAIAGTDSETMEKARGLFARGQFQKATELYTAIPASSDFWLEALEERAWSEVRMGDYEKALADLQSITSPVWSSQVGPETYMLSTFVSLKICAYKDVVKKIETFKKRMLPRVDALQAMLDQPLPESFWKLSSLIQKGQMTMDSLGSAAERYPRYFFRDKELIAALKANKKEKVQNRMRLLAQQDMSEIELNLKKMKIIDVEVIQKVLLADKKAKKQKSDLRFASLNSDEKLTFPVTDDEVWVDEVGHFEAKADKCPYDTRKSL